MHVSVYHLHSSISSASYHILGQPAAKVCLLSGSNIGTLFDSISLVIVDIYDAVLDAIASEVNAIHFSLGVDIVDASDSALSCSMRQASS